LTSIKHWTYGIFSAWMGLVLNLGLMAGTTAAAPPAPSDRVWAVAREISASEAVQAAAADEQAFYAISSTKIAKYDRKTGERVAVSQGKAEHLNSGFFWKGQLYCAHSNYPRVPEKSKIMALDPKTMQLSTFKDFGNAGGSLTWAIRHQGSWWCNFAKYGPDNASTFLVRYDDAWNETGRWSYPAEVFSELHNYSFSGGIWHEDSLLLTGHDDPVLFRFTLDSSNRLTLVEKQKIPFTGQGIAIDPITQGLVGIDRARRKIIQSKPLIQSN